MRGRAGRCAAVGGSAATEELWLLRECRLSVLSLGPPAPHAHPVLPPARDAGRGRKRKCASLSRACSWSGASQPGARTQVRDGFADSGERKQSPLLPQIERYRSVPPWARKAK